MSVAYRQIDRRFHSIVSGQNRCPTLDKKTNGHHIAIVSGHMKWGVSIPVPGVDIGTCCNKGGDNGGMSAKSSVKKRRIAVLGPSVRRHHRGDEKLDNWEMAFHCRHVERRDILGARSFEIGTRRCKRLHFFQVPFKGRINQRGIHLPDVHDTLH